MKELTKDSTFGDYCILAKRTELTKKQYKEAGKRLAEFVRLDHALKGIVTEVGELGNLLKRYVIYDTTWTIKEQNKLIEEAGDLAWYIAILFDEIWLMTGGKVDPQAILALNIQKLQVRYPEKFNKQLALFRDIDAELEPIKDANTAEIDQS